MSITFKAQKRKIPNSTQPPKYYASLISKGTVSLEDIAKQIAYENSVTESDCYAVLIALEQHIKRALCNGNIVSLNNLGNFRLSATSTAQNNANALKASHITNTKVLFKPGKALKLERNNLHFNKIK